MSKASIDIVERKLKAIEEALLFITSLNANNSIVIFSPLISDQVGESHAANAFNVVQRALMEIEVTRILALWDAPRNEADTSAMNSFCSISKMLSDEEVKSELSLRAKSYQVTTPILNINLDQKTLSKIVEHAALNAAEHTVAAIEAVCERIERIANSDAVKKLRNFRNKHVAHLLEQTKSELSSGRALPMPKYGDHGELLTQSLEVHKELLSAVQSTWLDWSSLDRRLQAKCSVLLAWLQDNSYSVT